MSNITEDKVPIPLFPDKELCDVRIGATEPALFFRIDLDTPCQIILEFQEFNSAARCVLLLSPTDPHPSTHTAVWKSLSPDQNKTIIILPSDPAYRLGPLYLAVRYVEESGNTFIRLKLTLHARYEVEWYAAANRALYYGSWLGCNYHGRGRCIYGVDPDVAEDGTVEWSARSLLQQSDAKSWCRDFTPLLDDLELRDSMDRAGWSLLPLPSSALEVYDGEWVCGRKEGLGVYQWKDRAYWGMWRLGVREGLGVMCTRDGFRYEGNWLHDQKHGHGKATYPDGTQYEGDWENDMRSGKGRFEYTNGVVIDGSWLNDELVSDVVAHHPDGSRYVGEWSNHCRHGRGTERDAQRHVFSGTWERNRRSGPGQVTFANGVVCVAEWVDGARRGGTFTFPNAEVYTGDWSDALSCREGNGRCVYPNGDVYEGAWRGDVPHGKGHLVQGGGARVYDGEWRDGERDGRGVQSDEFGVYDGAFSRNSRSGEGVFCGRDGSVYKGHWQDDCRVGPGVTIDAATGTTYEGLFLLGKLQSVGRSSSAADTYEGTWLDGLRHGVGVTKLPNGDVLRHAWHRGAAQDGAMRRTYANGDTYEGEWRNGQRDGIGTQRYADGSVYTGAWRNDKPNGSGRLTDGRGVEMECEWRDGERVDGVGKRIHTDGSVYEGELRGGKPHGLGRLIYADGTTFEGKFAEGIYLL